MKRLNHKITITKYRKRNQIPTNKELRKIVLRYQEHKNWYLNSHNKIKELFPCGSGLFTKILAVTSQKNDLRANVDFAFMCYESIQNKNDISLINFGIANPSIQGNIKRVLNGKLPQGNKIQPFTLALLGDLSQVVIDTHITKYFTNNKKRIPCKTDIRHINYIIRKISKQVNMLPSETQACIWTHIKLNMEYSREKNDKDYTYYLETTKQTRQSLTIKE